MQDRKIFKMERIQEGNNARIRRRKKLKNWKNWKNKEILYKEKIDNNTKKILFDVTFLGHPF